MRHDHHIAFPRWLHPAMWHVALESWQWIHQVAAPTWPWDDMPLNSPSGKNPAMWQLALESWHWICQVAAPAMWQVALGWHAIKFTQTSATLKFYIWFQFRPHHHTRRHSAPVTKILSKSDHPQYRKKWRHVDFQDGGSQLIFIFYIRFWYLRCCSCPWNRGRQHLATPLKTCHNIEAGFLTGWLLCLSPNSEVTASQPSWILGIQ